MQIHREILDEIFGHARNACPEECCGLLLGNPANGIIVGTLRAANVADPSTRRTRYTLDPRVILAAQRAAPATGMEILGVYHSHPDHPVEPSNTDAVHAWDELLYLIVRVNSQNGVIEETRVWRFLAQKPVEESLVILDPPPSGHATAR